MTIRISGIDQTSGQETIVNGDSGKLLIGPSTGTAHYALTVWGTGNSIIRTGCWANDAGTTSGSQFYAVRDGTAGVAITCLSASFTPSGINLADSASLGTDNGLTNGLIIGAGSSTARPTRFNVGGSFVAALTTTPALNLVSGLPLGWGSSPSDPTAAADAQFKRDGTGFIGVYAAGSTYGSLRIGDGLSSAPSIAFGGETTLGLFKSNPGFQTLASTVDGNAGAVVRNYGNSGTTTRCGFSVYSDGGVSPGNVSINTLSPGWSTSGLLTPSTGVISSDGNTTGGLTLYTLASAPITLGTNNASRWTINSSGRLAVSIGGSWSASSPEILGPTDGSLFISAADSGSGGNDAYFSGSVGSGAGNPGGSAFIQGGTPTDGQGGAVTIRGAAGVGTSRAGGAVTINGGTGGSSNGLGGAITIRSGTGDGTGAGGALSIQSGSSGSTAGSSGGSLTIFSGGASGPFSNMPAGNVTIYAGIGTGSSTNKLLFQTGYQLGSGGSPQSNYDRQLFPNNTKALSTTTATPTEFVRMALTTTDSAGGCVVDGTIAVADGSHNVGCIAFTMIVSAVNQNGTVTAECSTFTDESTGSVITGGTFTGLTVVYSVTITGTSVQLLVAPAWSAGTPTSVVLSYQVRGNGRVTFTPQ